MARNRIWLIALALVAMSRLAWAVPPMEVTIGAEDDWYPYSGVEDGKLGGLAVDIVREAFAAEGIHVHFSVLPYARCMYEVRKGRLLGCFDAPRTRQIEADYLWHKPALYSAQAFIYGAAGSSDKGLRVKDLEGKQVAITNTYGYGNSFDDDTRIEKVITNRDIYGLRMLAAGRLPYFACYGRTMAYLRERYPGIASKVKQVGFIARTDLYMAFSKTFPGSQALLDRFNAGFRLIRANGRYVQIFEKWDRRFPGTD